MAGKYTFKAISPDDFKVHEFEIKVPDFGKMQADAERKEVQLRAQENKLPPKTPIDFSRIGKEHLTFLLVLLFVGVTPPVLIGLANWSAVLGPGWQGFIVTYSACLLVSVAEAFLFFNPWTDSFRFFINLFVFGIISSVAPAVFAGGLSSITYLMVAVIVPTVLWMGVLALIFRFTASVSEYDQNDRWVIFLVTPFVLILLAWMFRVTFVGFAEKIMEADASSVDTLPPREAMQEIVVEKAPAKSSNTPKKATSRKAEVMVRKARVTINEQRWEKDLFGRETGSLCFVLCEKNGVDVTFDQFQARSIDGSKNLLTGNIAPPVEIKGRECYYEQGSDAPNSSVSHWHRPAQLKTDSFKEWRNEQSQFKVVFLGEDQNGNAINVTFQ